MTMYCIFAHDTGRYLGWHGWTDLPEKADFMTIESARCAIEVLKDSGRFEAISREEAEVRGVMDR